MDRMSRRDIIIGLLVLAVIAGVVYFARRPKPLSVTVSPTPSVEERLENSFNLQIPDDVERADLRDVSGGTGSGIATRKFESGSFTHSVLADLPDPATGGFYEGWLVRGKEGDSNFSLISAGRMRIAKGGYVLDFQSNKDYTDHTNVVITLEKVDDKKPETHILEGNF